MHRVRDTPVMRRGTRTIDIILQKGCSTLGHSHRVLRTRVSIRSSLTHPLGLLCLERAAAKSCPGMEQGREVN